jgi:hypothetical protein
MARLYMYGLFNDAFSSSQYTVQNDRLIIDWRIGKDVNWSDCELFRSTHNQYFLLIIFYFISFVDFCFNVFFSFVPFTFFFSLIYPFMYSYILTSTFLPFSYPVPGVLPKQTHKNSSRYILLAISPLSSLLWHSRHVIGLEAETHFQSTRVSWTNISSPW